MALWFMWYFRVYLYVQALWDDYMDVPRQREKQAKSPVQFQDSQLPQKLQRQTCKYHFTKFT